MRLHPGSLLLAVTLLAGLTGGCADSVAEAPAPAEAPAVTSRATATPSPSPAPSAAPAPSPTPPPQATASPRRTPVATPSPTSTATPTPTPTATPSPTPSASPPPTPTPDPRPARCEGLEERGATFTAAVEEAMDGYAGGWGLALIDLDCDAVILVNPEHSQYPASAGKIVVVITALRAVQDGLLEFETIQHDVETVLSLSLDYNSDLVNERVSSEQIAAMLDRAGVSDVTEYEHSWRWAHFSPIDLARVWASLVRGEQLDEEWTAYLLDLASRPILGPGFWPFPAGFGVDGFDYGQKAGYWTSGEPVGYRVSAGYARPEDGSSEGYVFAFMIRAVREDLAGYWQRPVFPLFRDFMVAEMGADTTSNGAGE